MKKTVYEVRHDIQVIFADYVASWGETSTCGSCGSWYTTRDLHYGVEEDALDTWIHLAYFESKDDAIAYAEAHEEMITYATAIAHETDPYHVTWCDDEEEVELKCGNCDWMPCEIDADDEEILSQIIKHEDFDINATFVDCLAKKMFEEKAVLAKYYALDVTPVCEPYTTLYATTLEAEVEEAGEDVEVAVTSAKGSLEFWGTIPSKSVETTTKNNIHTEMTTANGKKFVKIFSGDVEVGRVSRRNSFSTGAGIMLALSKIVVEPKNPLAELFAKLAANRPTPIANHNSTKPYTYVL